MSLYLQYKANRTISLEKEYVKLANFKILSQFFP